MQPRALAAAETEVVHSGHLAWPWAKRHDLEMILAYLDPGSGSVVLQLILGGAAAVAVTSRFYWRRLKGLLRPGRTGESGRPEP